MMPTTSFSATDLPTGRLCLGGNVFGWTADRDASFAVLDAFREAGGTFVDTADAYSAWVDGNSGGESEQLLGDWMADRGCRDELVVATKVGSRPGLTGLAATTIGAGVQASLGRLQTDRVDLYYSHRDDPDTPQQETARALQALVAAGSVRALGASNFSAERLASAQDAGTGYTAVQPLLNLVERDYQHSPAPRGLACFPYAALASGFLTGKYRSNDVTGPRAAKASAYGDDRGVAVLKVVEQVAEAHGVPMPAIAVAWVAAQPTVTAPIVSARTVEQLQQVLPALTLRLTQEELAALTAAGERQEA